MDIAAAVKVSQFHPKVRSGCDHIPLKLCIKSFSAVARLEFGKDFARVFMFKDSIAEVDDGGMVAGVGHSACHRLNFAYGEER